MMKYAVAVSAGMAQRYHLYLKLKKKCRLNDFQSRGLLLALFSKKEIKKLAKYGVYQQLQNPYI